MWHDAEGEFAATFAELAEGGFGEAVEQRLPRPVRFVEACDGHMFEVKRLIAREDTTSDMLVYRQQGRGGLEGDWLADVELYADQFSADYLSLLADQRTSRSLPPRAASPSFPSVCPRLRARPMLSWASWPPCLAAPIPALPPCRLLCARA